MPKHVSQLDCFKKPIIFEVPDTVVRSITADIVCKKKTNNDEKARIFSQLRSSQRCSWARLAWENARMAFESYAPGSDVELLRLDLTKTLRSYMCILFNISENGIWNCGEFADFALMVIDHLLIKGIFKENEYMAKGVTLNNPRIPEGEQNHDHAFVLIMDKKGTPVFVIDLWQTLVTGKPFFGLVCEYIDMLRNMPDGYYVLPNVVADHIKVVSDNSMRRACGDRDDESGYYRALRFTGGSTPIGEKMGQRADIESFLQNRRCQKKAA